VIIGSHSASANERSVEQGVGLDKDHWQLYIEPRTAKPPHQKTLADAVTAAGKAAGLGHVTPQMLRRSFASVAARRVPDPAEASHMTGHSLDTWTRYYVGRFGPRRVPTPASACSTAAWAPSTARSADIPLTFRPERFLLGKRPGTKAPLKRGFCLSGRRDSNSGPLVPQTSALTRLRHAPRGSTR
jgi:Phage integrase family